MSTKTSFSMWRSKFGTTRLLEACALLLIILNASYWRLYHIDYRAMWFDEVEVVRVAQFPTLSKILAGAMSHASAPPGDYVLRHLWQLIGGVGDVWTRLFSAIWGLVGIIGTYLLGRKFFGAVAGLLAAALLSMSAFNVHYSVEVKFYALMIVTYSATILTWRRASEHNTRFAWLLYGAVSLFGLYCHPFVAFAILFCAATDLIGATTIGIRAKSFRIAIQRALAPILTNLIAIAAYLPWVFADYLKQNKGSFYPTVSLRDTLGMLALGNETIFPTVTVIGVFLALLLESRARKLHALPLWLTISVGPILVYVLDRYGGYWFDAKQLLFAQPILLILASCGILAAVQTVAARVTHNNHRTLKIVKALAAVLIIAIALPSTIGRLRREVDPASYSPKYYSRLDWRSFAQMLAPKLNQDDTVIWGPKDLELSPGSWYMQRSGFISQTVPLLRSNTSAPSLNMIRQAAARTTGATTWLFGNELERILTESAYTDSLSSTVINGVTVYSTTDFAAWNPSPLREPGQYLEPDGVRTDRVLLDDDYAHIYRASLSRQAANSCTLTLTIDGSAHSSRTLIKQQAQQVVDFVIEPKPTKIYDVGLATSCSINVDNLDILPYRSVSTSSGHPTIVQDSEFQARGFQRIFSRNSPTATQLTRNNDTLVVPVWIASPGTYVISVTARSEGEGAGKIRLSTREWLSSTVTFTSKNAKFQTSVASLDFFKAGKHEISLTYQSADEKRSLYIDAIEILTSTKNNFEKVTFVDAKSFAIDQNLSKKQLLLDSGDLILLPFSTADTIVTLDGDATYKVIVHAQAKQSCNMWPMLTVSANGLNLGEKTIESADPNLFDFRDIRVADPGPQRIRVTLLQPNPCKTGAPDPSLILRAVYLQRTSVNESSNLLQVDTAAFSTSGDTSLDHTGAMFVYPKGDMTADIDLPAGQFLLQVVAHAQRGCADWPVLEAKLDGEPTSAILVDSSDFRTYIFGKIDIQSQKVHQITFRTNPCTSDTSDNLTIAKEPLAGVFIKEVNLIRVLAAPE